MLKNIISLKLNLVLSQRDDLGLEFSLCYDYMIFVTWIDLLYSF